MVAAEADWFTSYSHLYVDDASIDRRVDGPWDGAESAAFFRSSWSARKPYAPVASGFRLTMNMNKARYVYVVNPGSFAGTPFFAAYEVENLVDRPDALPGDEVRGIDVDSARREWVGAVSRLFKAAHRLVRETVWRRASRAFGAAA